MLHTASPYTSVTRALRGRPARSPFFYGSPIFASVSQKPVGNEEPVPASEESVPQDEGTDNSWQMEPLLEKDGNGQKPAVGDTPTQH